MYGLRSYLLAGDPSEQVQVHCEHAQLWFFKVHFVKNSRRKLLLEVVIKIDKN